MRLVDGIASHRNIRTVPPNRSEMVNEIKWNKTTGLGDLSTEPIIADTVSAEWLIKLIRKSWESEIFS